MIRKLRATPTAMGTRKLKSESRKHSSAERKGEKKGRWVMVEITSLWVTQSSAIVQYNRRREGRKEQRSHAKQGLESCNTLWFLLIISNTVKINDTYYTTSYLPNQVTWKMIIPVFFNTKSLQNHFSVHINQIIWHLTSERDLSHARLPLNLKASLMLIELLIASGVTSLSSDQVGQ